MRLLISVVTTNLENPADWKRELREQSAGTYRLTLHDSTGQVRYSATGSDPEALMKDAQSWLSGIRGQTTPS
jgi:hypothetical protein